MVITGRLLAVGNCSPKVVVVGVREETAAEVEDRLLDCVAQPFADAGALVEGILMVALDQALCGVFVS